MMVILFGASIALPILNIFGSLTTGKGYAGNLIPLIPAFGLMSIFFTAVIASFLVSDSFAGEKERKTIESLLALPCTGQDYLISKIIVPFGIAALLNLGFMSFLGIGFNIVSFLMEKTLVVIGVEWYLIVGILSPLVSLTYVFIVILISSRVKSVKAAANISSLTGIPLFVLFIFGIMTNIRWDLPLILVASGLLVFVNIVFYYVSRTIVDREKLILDLD